ncbi:MAG: TetR/AcrR family transcriptional regulator, partial [Streptococcus gallolyticus]|nr:TetR/AcrR family transcriptional regulator [Streptococcus gallolyticus]
LVKIIMQELLTNSEMKHFIRKQIEQLAPSIDKIAERLCEGNHLRKTEVIRIAISPFFSYIMQMVIFDVESQDEEYDLALLEQQTLKLLSE